MLQLTRSITHLNINLHNLIYMTVHNNCNVISIALTEYGWERHDSTSTLDVTWDTSMHGEAANTKLGVIQDGAKEGRSCGPWCQCIHCTNSVNCPSVNTELHNLDVENQRPVSDDSTDTSSDKFEKENLDYNTAHNIIVLGIW